MCAIMAHMDVGFCVNVCKPALFPGKIDLWPVCSALALVYRMGNIQVSQIFWAISFIFKGDIGSFVSVAFGCSV